MKVTIGWLKDFVDFDLSAQELADKLDLSGTAVESVSYLGARLSNIIIGEVTSVEKHPQADRLKLCEVTMDGRRAGIVCGAPNVAVGQKVPVALPGAVLPSGAEIKAATIRGVQSQGMICSEAELELGPDASGIMVLPPDVESGRPLASAIGLDDWVLELEITPNRPDCMGVIGVAREVAALVGAGLTIPEIRLDETGPGINERAAVEILDPDLCPRYSARFVDRVKIGPSPEWMRRRLEAVGFRSINNVVDVTNYVLNETGQPLHAFNFKMLRGGRIIVRRAAPGERMETIDHVRRILEPDMLIIADAERPVALAGVMGGFDSEISDETTEILIESANFAPTNIRRTSRSLGLISESSLRFEKGVDIGGTVYAADRAAQLIAMTAGGRIRRGTIDNYPVPSRPRVIALRPDRLNAILGTEIPAKEIAGYLEGLELKVEADAGRLQVGIPTFRGDLEREIDLVEEVARIYGLNNIRAALLPSTDPERGLNPLQKLTAAIRQLMVGAGLFEAVNYSFISQADLDRLALPPGDPWTEAVAITNPLSEDQALLRTNLISSLMRTVAHNYNRGQKDLRVFEIGNVFTGDGKLPKEVLSLGVAMTGRRRPPAWFAAADGELDFFDLKGVIELMIGKLSLDCRIVAGSHPVLHPAQSALVVRDDAPIGFAGTLHPAVQENFGLRQPVYVMQLSLPAILSAVVEKRALREIPRYPAVTLDLALTVADQVTWEIVSKLVRETAGMLLVDLKLFDIYRGPGVPEDQKSLAFSLTYQAPDRTLTDGEVEGIQKKIIARAGKELGARLRD